MQHESTSPSPHSLASFDYQFNGALDEHHVREIASAAFVMKGENLLLVGGRGTGKSLIGFEVYQEASRQGLRVKALLPASTYSQCQHEELLRSAFGLVEDRYGPIGFGPSAVAWLSSETSRSRTEYLDCDVLVVDEFVSWLLVAPMQFKCLLARRIALGRSTVLVIDTDQWRWLLSSEEAKRANDRFTWKERMSLVRHYLPYGSASESLRERLAADCTFAEMLVTLGVGEVSPDVPSGSKGSTHAGSAHGQQLLQALSLNAYTQRLGNRNVRGHSSGGSLSGTPFGHCPVWHILYTGENSPRARRSAAA